MIIHVIGLVLAILTRKIKIDSLNDSKYSTAIIYCSCFLLILLTISNFAVSGLNRSTAVWTLFVFIGVCIFLGLTFIPKVRFMFTIHSKPIARLLEMGVIKTGFYTVGEEEV